jgi:pseudouridine-5'-monophosphatase
MHAGGLARPRPAVYGRIEMKLPRPVTHVIFDLDGLLLDTERYYTEATQQIVGRFGKRFDWSIKSNMMGRTAIEAARYLVRALDLPVAPEQYLKQREAILAELMPLAEPMPGAEEITRALHDAGVSQAIATSSERWMFELKVQRHREWLGVFDAVVVGDDSRLRAGKPAPDIFLLAAGELGAEPASCVVVEDAPAGVQAAHAAGMQVVAVPYPGMEPERLAQAELLLDSLTQITPADLGL